MRVSFQRVFMESGDNAVEPTEKIQVGEAIIPPGTRLSRGTIIKGIDFTECQNNDFEIKDAKGLMIIKGIYE